MQKALPMTRVTASHRVKVATETCRVGIDIVTAAPCQPETVGKAQRVHFVVAVRAPLGESLVLHDVSEATDGKFELAGVEIPPTVKVVFSASGHQSSRKCARLYPPQKQQTKEAETVVKISGVCC